MDAASGWVVTVNGTAVRLDDLPLQTWEDIVRLQGCEWTDAFYKPLADLAVARMVVKACVEHIGGNAEPVLATLTVPSLAAMFSPALDDLPTEVTDGVPPVAVDSSTDGSPS